MANSDSGEAWIKSNQSLKGEKTQRIKTIMNKIKQKLWATTTHMHTHIHTHNWLINYKSIWNEFCIDIS